MSTDTVDQINRLKEKAFRYFEETGFPGRKNENFLYTDTAPYSEYGHQPGYETALSENSETAEFLESLSDACIITMSSEKITVQGDQPEGLSVELKEADDFTEENFNRVLPYNYSPFTALNTTFINRQLQITVAENVSVDKPVVLLHLDPETEGVIYRRSLVKSGKNSELSFIEIYSGSERRNSLNHVCEFELSESARVHHSVIMNRADQAVRYRATGADLAARAGYSQRLVTAGSRRSRADIYIRQSSHSSSSLNSLSFLREKNHHDNQVFVYHPQPDAVSRQLFHHIVDDEAEAVFTGRVKVEQSADRIDAAQQSRTLQLSDDSKVYNRPQLEIYADDVACSHGATIGALDEDALFYLRSRGLSQQRAEKMLLKAFAYEAVGQPAADVAPLFESWLTANTGRLDTTDEVTE